MRGIDEVALPDLPKPDPKMLQIAEKIVEQQSGDFDPSEFRDRYEDALRALIEEKRKGHEIVQSKEPEDVGNVVDLMEALRKSLEGKGTTSKPKGSATVSSIKRKR